MRRFWSVFLAVAALSCLMILAVLPAAAYYPPLTTTATQAGNTITCTVNNPQLGTNVSQNFQGTGLQQHQGVIAWVEGSSSSDALGESVICCTYDPFLKKFQTDKTGPFNQVSQLTVLDGVVAYFASDASGSAYHYATYDPALGAWQKRKFDPTQGGIKTVSDQKVITKDGVVLFQNKWNVPPLTAESYEISVDIYDGLSGKWASEWGTWSPKIVYTDSFLPTPEIAHATVTVKWKPPAVDQPLVSKHGYDASAHKWYPEVNTKPMAYFVAQPTQGNSPLWVWFTDMSIGGNQWSWKFGDGATSASRSGYHQYTQKGIYVAQEQIIGAAGNSAYAVIILVGIQPFTGPSWLPAYSAMANQSDLGQLRQYRDEVLVKDSRGKFLNDRLYENSDAALNVLMTNPVLLLQARNLINANRGAVAQVLKGREGLVANPGKVMAFLQAFKEKSPMQLRALIDAVEMEIRQSHQEGKPFLGFRFGPPPRQ